MIYRVLPGRGLPELPGRPGADWRARGRPGPSSCASTILSRTFPTSGTWVPRAAPRTGIRPHPPTAGSLPPGAIPNRSPVQPGPPLI